MDQWLILEDLYHAYRDCRKRKENTEACAIFEINEIRNLSKLLRDLNNRTYTIGYSNAFCVTRPKLREVFAAEFRDRIVHHLILQRTMYLFEEYFIDDSYNCRVGKGTAYGHQRMLNMAAKYKDGWVLSWDISSFFMSIPKIQLANEIETFLRTRYQCPDLEEIIWMSRMVVLHRPQDKCIKKSDLELFNRLPRDKSLMTCPEGLGMAIGNLTSQIYANYHLSPFDHFALGTIKDDDAYGRYVDDLRAFCMEKQTLLRLMPIWRYHMKEDRHLRLHNFKWELQPVKKEFNFTGTTIKQGRMYAGKRTVGNFLTMIQHYNNLHEEKLIPELERLMQRYNSYSGYLIHYQSYAIRWRAWNLMDDHVKKFVYLERKLSVLKVRSQYRLRNKYKLDYYDIQQLHTTKPMGQHSTCTSQPLLGPRL